MAASGVVFIEAVVARVLAALGAGAAAGAAGEAAREAARKRQEAAEQAKATPAARADAQVQAKAKERCKECPPDKGEPHQRNFRERKPWVDYQARITGMPSGATFIVEWMFRGVAFDGFVSAECLLQEAKAAYDQFFDEYRNVLDWWITGEESVIAEAMRQGSVAQPRPPVQLRWYFMEPISFRHFSKIIKAAHPDVEVAFQP